jgi:ribosomal protein L18E
VVPAVSTEEAGANENVSLHKLSKILLMAHQKYRIQINKNISQYLQRQQRQNKQCSSYIKVLKATMMLTYNISRWHSSKVYYTVFKLL